MVEKVLLFDVAGEVRKPKRWYQGRLLFGRSCRRSIRPAITAAFWWLSPNVSTCQGHMALVYLSDLASMRHAWHAFPYLGYVRTCAMYCDARPSC